MLMMLISLCVTMLSELRDKLEVYSDADNVSNYMIGDDHIHWKNNVVMIIFTAFVALVTEGVIVLLRFLNPSCFNRYKIFGVLVKLASYMIMNCS